ncbi:MAG: divalent-cation tolerance protein CutA [Candidatus Zixiibacteriota bacterium]|nr:MAG: divalent-cation tolerance protein CutA [candidate division Zixibacteria bacterium]
MENLLVVYVTCGSEEEARRLASMLVENRLAACVNVTDVSSVYEWKGKIENDREKLLIIKTIEQKFGELEEFVKKNHSYQCPEIIALEVKAGSKEYIEWANSVIKADKK